MTGQLYWWEALLSKISNCCFWHKFSFLNFCSNLATILVKNSRILLSIFFHSVWLPILKCNKVKTYRSVNICQKPNSAWVCKMSGKCWAWKSCYWDKIITLFFPCLCYSSKTSVKSIVTGRYNHGCSQFNYLEIFIQLLS